MNKPQHIKPLQDIVPASETLTEIEIDASCIRLSREMGAGLRDNRTSQDIAQTISDYRAGYHWEGHRR